MMKWTKCAIRFLRISRPGVRVPSIAPSKITRLTVENRVISCFIMTPKRLECALFVPYGSKNALSECLTACLVLDARRGDLRAKKKPVRCVAGRAFVLFVGAAALSWVMHSGQWASLFQSWQGSCRPCGRHPPRCSSPPRGPQPLPMSGSGQSADGRSDTGVRPESWSKR